MSEQVKVGSLPKCDVCVHHERRPEAEAKVAKYDGKTKMGPWAYMCDSHFRRYGIGLGLGRGQALILARDR